MKLEPACCVRKEAMHSVISSRPDTASFYGIRIVSTEIPNVAKAISGRIFHYNTLARCGTMG